MDKSIPLIVALLHVVVMVDQSTQDLPLAAACKSANATCLSPSQCCSGICYKKCIARCLSVNYACSPSSDACCAGLKCGQSTKRCCRLAGQHISWLITILFFCLLVFIHIHSPSLLHFLFVRSQSYMFTFAHVREMLLYISVWIDETVFANLKTVDQGSISI